MKHKMRRHFSLEDRREEQTTPSPHHQKKKKQIALGGEGERG